MSFKSKLPRIIFFSFIIIIASVSIIYSFSPNPFEKNTNLKIMTWNISGAIGPDDKLDPSRILEEIKENDPDIIGLQEVDSNINISELAKELDMDYYYAEAGNTNEGNAILSKFRINDVDTIDLPLIDGVRARVLIKAELIIDMKKWDIYITHLSRYDKPKDHLNQAKFLANYISMKSSSRIILMGDLNFAPNTPPYTELMHNSIIKLKDTYAYLNEDLGYTFRSNSLFKRIDYIFCSQDLNPKKSQVIQTDASDHCAVLTQF